MNPNPDEDASSVAIASRKLEGLGPREESREMIAQLLLAAFNAREGQEAAEQALRQQTQRLACVSHELCSPLQPIRTAAALLGHVRSEDLPRLQATIERHLARLSRLVGDLLDVSRIDTGTLSLDCVVFDMARFIVEAVDACRPAIAARAQHLILNTPLGALPVHGDPARLAQVMANLLDNASRYTPISGEIRVSLAVVDANMAITVSDDGIGITAEALPHVFEPFVQDTHAVAVDATGLGIGLSIVRGLVQAHGGNVVARSGGPGLGSQFIVTLPLTCAKECGR